MNPNDHEDAVTLRWLTERLPARASLADALAHPRIDAPLSFARPVLHIAPDVLGGLDRCWRDIATAYRPLARHDRLAVREDGLIFESGGTFHTVPVDIEELGRLVAASGYALIHLHGVSPTIAQLQAAIRDAGGIPDVLTLHDFGFEQPELFDPHIDAARRERIREASRSLLCRVSRRTAPSAAVIDAARRFIGQDLEFACIPNGVDARQTTRFPLSRAALAAWELWREKEPGMPAVAVIGAIGPGKGADRLSRIGLALRQRGLQLVVLGYTSELQRYGWAEGDACFVHGMFEPVELSSLVDRYGVRLAYFPTIVPESFCYALSDAWRTGIPAVGHGAGALAERLVAPAGTMLPVDASDDEIVDALCTASEERHYRNACAELARNMDQHAPPLHHTLPLLDRVYLDAAGSTDAPSAPEDGQLAEALSRINSDTIVFRRELVRAALEISDLERQRDALVAACCAEDVTASSAQPTPQPCGGEEAGMRSQQPSSPIPASVEAVIVTYKPDLATLEACFRSVIDARDAADRLAISVHDNSCDPQAARRISELLDTLAGPAGVARRFVAGRSNIGFGQAINVMAEGSSADFLLLLNPDAALEPDALREVLSVASTDSPEAAAWEMRQIPYEHPKAYDPVTRTVPWFSGAGVLIRREAFVAVGGFDKRIFLYCEDVELSWRLRARGYILRYVARAAITHHTYSSPGEAKPQAIAGAVFGNLALRMRYGTLRDMVDGARMAVTEVFRPRYFPGHGKRMAWAGIRALRHAPHFLGTRIGATPTFTPAFAGWDYELRRTGAFFRCLSHAESKSLPRPLVSLLVHCTRGARMLDKILACIAFQTYRPLEVVVVEDGQGTVGDIVDRWRSRLRIRYRATGREMGRCQAITLARALSTGEWLGVLDDDTLLFADHVEVLLTTAQLTQRKVAYGLAWDTTCDWLDRDRGVWREITHHTRYGDSFDRQRLMQEQYIPLQAVQFHRSVWTKVGGFVESSERDPSHELLIRFARYEDFAPVAKTTCKRLIFPAG